MSDEVCGDCARRTWLLGALTGHLDAARARVDELLGLPDEELIAAVAGSAAGAVRGRHRGFGAAATAAAAAARERAGLHGVCRCAESYPAALRDLPAPPAVLHVLGDPGRLGPLLGVESVAIVGARRATAYGTEIAGDLGGGLGAAGVPVLSGMALGIDAAAHLGALGVDAPTVAVLAGGADRAYPAAHRRLHARIADTGLVVSELGPGTAARRWMFPARNRIIAALAALTVVVQGRERSGALVTARWARRLGRGLGAVPGPVTVPASAGPHRLLAEGARLITGPADALDGLGGVGGVAPAAAAPRLRGQLDPELRRLLDALADGEAGEGAFRSAGLGPDAGLAGLAALELAGAVRRGVGGRWRVRW